MNNVPVINVGQKVKSFDFEGVDDCFIVGIVEEVNFSFEQGFNSYKIRVLQQVMEGEVVKDYEAEGIEHYVFPPMNGTPKAFSFRGEKVCKFVHPFE